MKIKTTCYGASVRHGDALSIRSGGHWRRREALDEPKLRACPISGSQAAAMVALSDIGSQARRSFRFATVCHCLLASNAKHAKANACFALLASKQWHTDRACRVREFRFPLSDRL